MKSSAGAWVRLVIAGACAATVAGCSATDLTSDRGSPRWPLSFAQLSLGFQHTCALTSAGKAYCWGDNVIGALGDGTYSPSTTPVAVAGGLTFTSISVGGYHSCGLATDGAAWCWGSNGYGESGSGTFDSHRTPSRVASSVQLASLSTGATASCGLTASGAAFCWGGQSALTPTPYAPALAFRKIVVSFGQPMSTNGLKTVPICGITVSGAAYCSGPNGLGQVGDGTTINRDTAVAVAGGLTFQDISIAASYVCAVSIGGTAYCWGSGDFGQLGNGASGDRGVPTAVAGSITFRSIAAGKYGGQTCALTTQGAAYCWGELRTGLGDGSIFASGVPVPVGGSLRFSSIVAGTGNFCAMTAAGATYCWGLNPAGQFGDGTRDSRSTPTLVSP